MLAAIGIILILKQLPHAVGYDKDFVGDESFLQRDGENTFTEILNALSYLNFGAVIIFAASMLILILWERPFIKNNKFSTLLPAPLLVVLIGVLTNVLYMGSFPNLAIEKDHLVSLPDTTCSMAEQWL